jgi:integrase
MIAHAGSGVNARFFRTLPSEAAGLPWGDVDLDRGVIRVVRSRHLYEDSAPKTGQAMRTVETLPGTVRILQDIQPLRVTPETPVVTNTKGRAIEPKAFSSARWYSCLRALGIRQRGIYATKDTYITALTAGVNTTWLEEQTGVRYETLRRHYGKWLRTEGADQLRKLAGLAPTDDDAEGDREPNWCEEGDLNPSDGGKSLKKSRGR